MSKLEVESKPFKGVFENWLIIQEQSLKKLRSAAEADTESETESTQNLRQLVHRVMTQYEKYYRAKSDSAKNNVLEMITPAWRSGLEGAFLWIGGWRPTMAIQLLYSISGLQLEARLTELLNGLESGDLGELSCIQLNRVNELQGEIIKEERELTEKLASQQEAVADSPMVELSHMATELTRDSDSEKVDERVKMTLESKEGELEEIFKKANDLRLKTLRNVVDILSPIQAIHFLIAAAELHLRVHDWGMKKDAAAAN